MATNAKVQCPATVLLHFHLHSIRHLAHFTIVHQLLAEYYPDGDDNGLHVVDIPYNVGHRQAVKKWAADAARLIDGLWQYKHTVVFVTTHSDPDTGDLWLGQDEADESCATTVGKVSTVFLVSLHTDINRKPNSGLTSF